LHNQGWGGESLPVPIIRLLSTDFDGTLAGGSHGDRCVPALASELGTVLSEGTVWALNTGRPLEAALDGIASLGIPFSPHYLLTSERHIHRPDGRGGWDDFGDWNGICREHHDLLFRESGGFFARINALAERHAGIRVLQNITGVPEGLVAEDEEILDAMTRAMEALPGRPKDFHYQRSNIYLRFCHRSYDKGSSLAELSRLLDMTTDGILAIGDHQNDLSMLFGEVAAMVACPSNAHPSVKEAVRRAGGYVSDREAGEGTAEAISYFRSGGKPGRSGESAA
jgi:hydroxymethylpyrimidine pyrophosphatase-like HAD family hydrolase